MSPSLWIWTKVWMHPARKKLKPGKDLRLQPDNLGVSSEMTIGGPRNKPDGPPTSLGGTETARHQQQPGNTVVCGPRRSARTRTCTWNTIYREFEPH